MFKVKILIAFYSRTGNTKNIAGRITQELKNRGVEDIMLEEIREVQEERKGVLGYLRAGKDAMRGKSSSIVHPQSSVEEFDLLLIGSPVWAWNLSPPVRSYCTEYGIKAGKVSFFCTMGGSGDKKLFSEMQKCTGREPAALLSFNSKEIKNSDILLEKTRAFVSSIFGNEEL